MVRVVRTLSAVLFSLSICVPPPIQAQGESQAPAAQAPVDPTAAPKPQKLDKEARKKLKKTLKELDTPYKQWLNEDVIYIISPEERQAFLQLATNEEREQFIEQFWLRRSANPDLPDNDFKEEHYRRIAYANEHFASGIPGWKTDRGRMYIMWGPADEVESHPTGGTYDRPMDEGGGASKTDRFTRADGMTTPTALGGTPSSMDEFNRLEQYSKAFKPPAVKYKDLEAIVTARIVRDQMKFNWGTDYVKVTNDTVLVPITVQVPNNQLSFNSKDGVYSPT